MADRRVVKHEVTILGPTNIAADVALDASQMFSHNMTKFLLNLADANGLRVVDDDDVGSRGDKRESVTH